MVSNPVPCHISMIEQIPHRANTNYFRCNSLAGEHFRPKFHNHIKKTVFSASVSPKL